MNDRVASGTWCGSVAYAKLTGRTGDEKGMADDRWPMLGSNAKWCMSLRDVLKNLIFQCSTSSFPSFGSELP